MQSQPLLEKGCRGTANTLSAYKKEVAFMAKAALATSEDRSPQKSTSTPNQVAAFWTRTVDFLKDVRGEMRKVVTPSRAEVQSTTAVVIVTVFVFAAFFYVVDSVLGSALKWLLHWLGGQ